MKTNIKATNIELTEAITDYLTKKIDSLEKFISVPMDSVSCDAEVGKTTKHHKTGEDIYKAELNILLGGTLIRIEKEENNLYAAIDKVRDEAARALTRSQTKKIDLLRRGATKIKNIMKGFRW